MITAQFYAQGPREDQEAALQSITDLVANKAYTNDPAANPDELLALQSAMLEEIKNLATKISQRADNIRSLRAR